MNFKRICTMLIALCMVVSLVPVSALQVFAEETDDATMAATEPVQAQNGDPVSRQEASVVPDASEIVKFGTVNYSYTNPAHEGLFELEKESRPETHPGQVSKPQATEFLHFEYAAQALRQGMVARHADIPVRTYVRATSLNEAISLLLFEALKHTGNPTEGDYLNWNVYDFSISGTYSEIKYPYATEFDLDITFHFVYLTTAEQEAQMDAAVKGMLDMWNVYDASEYTKIKTIYDYIAGNITYDVPDPEAPNALLMYTPYGALINKSATAYGMSLLMYRFALELGVDCRVISGYQTSTGYDHVWNIVELYDVYYNVDVAADSGQTEYYFFLAGHTDFYDHTREETYNTTEFHNAYPMEQTSYVPYEIGAAGENIAWAFDATTETLTVVGTGDAVLGGWSDCPWANRLKQIRNVVVGEGISTLGNYIFYQYPHLEKVIFPGSLRYIGASAFEGCANLKDVTFSEGLLTIGEAAFMNCDAMEQIVFPQSLTVLPDRVCEGNEKLTSVSLPANLVQIGNAAFAFCESLTAIHLPEGLQSIGTQAFYGAKNLNSIIVPNSVTAIGDYAFAECRSMASIVLPKGLVELPKYVCYHNNNMTSVTWPEELVQIKDHAFSYCSALTTIELPATLETIQDYAFLSVGKIELYFTGHAPEIEAYTFAGATVVTAYYPQESDTWNDVITKQYGGTVTWIPYDCPIGITGTWGDNIAWNLDRGVLTISGTGAMDEDISVGAYPWYEFKDEIKEVTIESGVTTVPASAFAGYSALEKVTLPEGITSIGIGAFQACAALKEIKLPSTLKTISDCAFSMSGLTSVNFPVGLESIGGEAFMWTFLADVVIPDTVTSMGRDAFSGCEQLKSVVLSSGCPVIPNSAFRDCIQLETLTIPEGVTTLGWNCFTGCKKLTNVTLPESLENMENACFSNCTSLTRMVIPAGVKVFVKAFMGCSNLSVIIFEGEAPVGDGMTELLDSVAFTGVTATIYHPNDESWTEEVKQQYGGNLTWVAYEPLAFEDAAPDQYFYNPIVWAVEAGITNGTTASTFSPENTCTREQIVTFLWRAAGKPEPTLTENPFEDVTEASYAYKAILWALENGITTGTSATTFGLQDVCTREQVATFLWRAAGKPMPGSTENIFTDLNEGNFGYYPILWAAENGITTGYGNGLFGLNDTCTRGQIVTFLYRAFAE